MNAVVGVGSYPVASGPHQVGSSPMRQPSADLPEKLKRSLAGLAERTGHSGAELIKKLSDSR